MLQYPRSIDEQIVKIFQEAEKKLQEEILFAIKNKKEYAYLENRLKEIQNELLDKYKVYSDVAIREFYIDGMLYYDKENTKYIKEVENKTTLAIADRIEESTKIIGTLGGVHTNFVEQLILQGNLYVRQSLDNVLKGILGTFSQATIVGAFENLGRSETLGYGGFKTRKELEGFLTSQGATNFIDKAGRKWTMGRYTEMLTRTETAKAKNFATLVRGKELGVKKYKRNERLDCCPICVPHINEIVNIDEGMPYLILHPQCRGFWEPIFS